MVPMAIFPARILINYFIVIGGVITSRTLATLTLLPVRQLDRPRRHHNFLALVYPHTRTHLRLPVCREHRDVPLPLALRDFSLVDLPLLYIHLLPVIIIVCATLRYPPYP